MLQEQTVFFNRCFQQWLIGCIENFNFDVLSSCAIDARSSDSTVDGMHSLPTLRKKFHSSSISFASLPDCQFGRLCTTTCPILCWTRFGRYQWLLWSKTGCAGDSWMPLDILHRRSSCGMVSRSNMDWLWAELLCNDTLGCSTLRLVHWPARSWTKHSVCDKHDWGFLHRFCWSWNCSGQSS